MGLYNVVKPCVVGKLHHVRPTSQPVEVDDATAAPLVEAGCLEPFGPQRISTEQCAESIQLVEVGEGDAEAPKPPRRPRSRRHTSED